ncbi:hypothetical protein TWF730_007075 [Orbilia blumenaviensis]|uniref:Uncharacterized protein n=1 Tax=Orbilia blumenaviensis TaxID=1796055 RepID=A0AAV9VG61_9PEZI
MSHEQSQTSSDSRVTPELGPELSLENARGSKSDTKREVRPEPSNSFDETGPNSITPTEVKLTGPSPKTPGQFSASLPSLQWPELPEIPIRTEGRIILEEALFRLRSSDEENQARVDLENIGVGAPVSDTDDVPGFSTLEADWAWDKYRLVRHIHRVLGVYGSYLIQYKLPPKRTRPQRGCYHNSRYRGFDVMVLLVCFSSGLAAALDVWLWFEISFCVLSLEGQPGHRTVVWAIKEGFSPLQLAFLGNCKRSIFGTFYSAITLSILGGILLLYDRMSMTVKDPTPGNPRKGRRISMFHPIQIPVFFWILIWNLVAFLAAIRIFEQFLWKWARNGISLGYLGDYLGD